MIELSNEVFELIRQTEFFVGFLTGATVSMVVVVAVMVFSMRNE